MRRGFAIGVVMLWALLPGCDTARKHSGPWNVLVLTLDTTRADHIGAFGGRSVPTPNLDRAAGEGTRFLQTISPVPLTLPAHSSIFTGQLPTRHGVRHNGAYKLAPSAVTLAERLHEAGYRTGAFVAAFVLDATFGLAQGFDVYSGVAHDGAAADFLRPADLQRPARAVNEDALRFIRAGGKPFFAWLHYYDAHHPYAPPEEPSVTLTGAGYDREISYIDHSFGELVGELRSAGLLDDTILVVVGDHGESLGSHGENTHGLFLYEAALHVPLFVRAPGLVDADGTQASITSLTDVAPTVLSLLGLPPLAGIDGISLWKDGDWVDEDPHRLVYGETRMPRIELGWSDLAMVRDSRHKYIRAPRPELYDLREDPGEERNLLESQPELAVDYREALAEITASETADSGENRNALSREELAKLQSLGYLGTLSSAAGGGDLPDPKDRIGEATATEAGDELLERGDFAGALARYDEVIRKNPRNHTALQRRARTLLRRGDLEPARDAALTALAAAGSDAAVPPALADNARALLATTLSLLGRSAEAAHALRAEPGSTQPPSPAHVLMAAAKNEADARAIVQLAQRHQPANPWTWAATIELERRSANAAALEAARERLAACGPQAAAAAVDAGARAQAAGDLPLALKLFETAARLKPRHPDIVGYLAAARLASGDLPAAEAEFELVRQLRPNDPRAPMYLAEIALARGDEARAQEWIEEALRKAPQFVPPLLNYARWLEEKGRTSDAVRVTESALARRPNDRDAADLLQRLRARGGSANG